MGSNILGRKTSTVLRLDSKNLASTLYFLHILFLHLVDLGRSIVYTADTAIKAHTLLQPGGQASQYVIRCHLMEDTPIQPSLELLCMKYQGVKTPLSPEGLTITYKARI